MISQRIGPVRIKGSRSTMTDDQDWTFDAEGRSNSSEEFNVLVNVVFRLLQSDALGIQSTQGRYSAARLIVARLAHDYGMRPTKQ